MTDELNEDPIAAMDQGIKGLHDFAQATRACYDGHIEAGFTEEQAFAIAKAWFLQTAKVANDG
jgi:hypothetical protein